MLSLPIPVLHRIFNLCNSKNDKKFNENPNEVIEFLFKCLDKFGEDASILFSYVDFEKQSIGVVNRLIQNYSDQFDFNFINSTLLKTTIQLTSEVTKMKEEFSSLIFQMKQKQEEEFLKIEENEEKRKKIFEEEMAKMKEEERKREKEFLKMKEDEEKRKKLFEEEFEKIKEEEKRKKKELDHEIKKIKENEEKILKELQNENVKEFSYVKGNEFHGIMRFLTEQTGGNIHNNKTVEITSNFNRSKDPPKNLVDYDHNNYYNSGSPESEPKICFDFKDKSIQLSNYSIKSHENDSGDGYSTKKFSGHLKNWVIEVSNDGQTWETINRHVDDSTLNGSSIVATFSINPKPTKFYRYVQLRTTGVSWYGNNRYDIFFYFIEFYGKLKEPKS